MTSPRSSCCVQVEGLGTAGSNALQPLRHQVDTDDPLALVQGDAAGHVADRSESEHHHRAAVRHVRVGHRLPRRGQHVRQVDEARVRWPLRDLDVGELRLRDPEVLRLAAGHLAIQLGVAEQRGTHPLLADLGGLALGVQLLVAHEAVPAGDLERQHHAVAGLQVPGFAADLLHDAHRLVTEDVALAHERTERFVQVQVGATDVGRRDPYDRVRRLLDDRVRNRVDADVLRTVPGHCPHVLLLL